MTNGTIVPEVRELGETVIKTTGKLDGSVTAVNDNVKEGSEKILKNGYNLGFFLGKRSFNL